MQTKEVEHFIIHSDARFFSKKLNRFMATPVNSHGYCQIRFMGRMRKVHRIIAETFISNPNNLPQVNHKDGNKRNNNVNNLEWCTASYNISHAYRTGLNPCNSKYSEWQVKAVRLFLKYKIYSRKKTSELMGISIDSIGKIIRGESYTHFK